ncbi:MAG TPA: macro domain-containing protein [Clostridiales bacterium]|jgi:O-acetyl-ADP-ribose deacetylase (regulator of RNase III)|nr:macro domain-containing protein [Clostridiales bacterium]HRT81579.1 macro domain-containing protein [Oscillospiraceae bacterium]
MPFTIIRQDITKLEVDAIVNAANTELRMGGGVCGAIFEAAGPEKLQAACDKLAPIKTGEAVITPGFGLPAKFVIHTAGPVYRQYDQQESERLLRAAYTNSMKLALENSCESIAFPLISSGIYGYPKDEALRVASTAIQDFIENNDLDVRLVVFGKAAFDAGRELYSAIESYIDEHYVDEHTRKHRYLLDVEERDLSVKGGVFERSTELSYDGAFDVETAAPAAAFNIDMTLDEPFSQTLLRLIDAKGMTDVEVYKRANLDRKLFSKIRSNTGYMPSKRTALALAIGLKLSLEETEDLLKRAGFALSNSVMFDVIVEYFIKNEKYNIFEINEVLFDYDQAQLGG